MGGDAEEAVTVVQSKMNTTSPCITFYKVQRVISTFE